MYESLKGWGRRCGYPLAFASFPFVYNDLWYPKGREKIRSGEVGGGLRELDVNINHRFFSFHILNLKSHVLCEDYRQFPAYILQCKAVPVGKLHQSVLGNHHRISQPGFKFKILISKPFQAGFDILILFNIWPPISSASGHQEIYLLAALSCMKILATFTLGCVIQIIQLRKL